MGGRHLPGASAEFLPGWRMSRSAKLCKLCLEKQCELQDLSLEELRSVNPLFDQDFYACLKLESVLAIHDVPGGTAPARVRQAMADGKTEDRVHPRGGSMRTRKAILPDAQQIHDLISAYSGDGTLLPRTLAEICENVRDFVVLEDDGRIIGCGALHLYGPHLAEIRSITVAPRRRARAVAATGEGVAGGGEEAPRHLHLPVHAHAGILRSPGIRNGAARGSARQDLQRLPRLSPISLLR